MKTIKLGKTLVGHNCPVYIVAELSCNHRGDKQIALDTIKSLLEETSLPIKV